MAIKSVEVEYLESGTFVTGEEDVCLAGIKRGETCVVLKTADFKELKKAARELKALKKESK